MSYKATHKTVMVIEIEHVGELPDLPEMICARAHTMDKVEKCFVSAQTQKPLTDVNRMNRHYIGIKAD